MCFGNYFLIQHIIYIYQPRFVTQNPYATNYMTIMFKRDNADTT